MAEDFKMTTCPLCGSEAKQYPITGDHVTYDCQNDTLFDISGTRAQELENHPHLKQEDRERIARARKRGITGVIKLRS